MIRLEIPGLPPSINVDRGNLREAMRIRAAYKAQVMAAAIEAGVFQSLVGSKGTPLRAEIAYLFGPKSRSSDTVSNREKALLDALKTAEVITDDRWVRMAEVASAPAKESRTLIKLWPIAPVTEDLIWRWYYAPRPLMEQAMEGQA